MFSKEASRQLRQEFWTAFGKSFPRKWILYRTGIKDFFFKFHFDTRKARVLISIEGSDTESRLARYKKLKTLKTILLNEYLPEAVFEDSAYLDNGKEISRVYVELPNVSVHNKETWQKTMAFLNDAMQQFEAFWVEYQDIIR